jgi:hypothetical protein
MYPTLYGRVFASLLSSLLSHSPLLAGCSARGGNATLPWPMHYSMIVRVQVQQQQLWCAQKVMTVTMPYQGEAPGRVNTSAFLSMSVGLPSCQGGGVTITGDLTCNTNFEGTQ